MAEAAGDDVLTLKLDYSTSSMTERYLAPTTATVALRPHIAIHYTVP